MVPCCKWCNGAKSNRTVKEFANWALSLTTKRQEWMNLVPATRAPVVEVADVENIAQQC